MADLTSTRTKVAQRGAQYRAIAAADMRTQYRRAAPHKTGATQNSVDVVRFRTEGTRLACTAQATTRQARWTNDGTRPHVIRPRRAKALRFRVRGRVVYARRVNHPGTPGTRWFSRTGPREWGPALRRAQARFR